MTVQIEFFVKVCVLLKYMSGVLQINVWALIVRTRPGPMSWISEGLLYISICFLIALPIKAAINSSMFSDNVRHFHYQFCTMLYFIKIFLLPDRAVSHTIIIVQTFGGY